MKPASRYWADLSTRDFAALQAGGIAARTLAVLPVAAIEQHGPHLPLSVDTVLANGIVAAAVEHLDAALPVLFLPTQALGLSIEHARFAGTLTLKSETILRLWTDIGESVAAAGIQKLLIFNTHGGNVGLMDLVARDLRARLDLLVYSASWFNLPLFDEHEHDVSALFDASEHRFGIHAGEIETSMMLALDPAHVAMQHAQDFDSSSRQRAQRFAILGNGKSAKLGWQMQDINPAGAAGNARAATCEKGRAVVTAAGRALARLLTEIDQLSPETLVARPASGK